MLISKKQHLNGTGNGSGNGHRVGCSDCEMRDTNFFCDLPQDERRRFDKIKISRNFAKGKVIFVEGQPSSGVYMLCQGRVKLSTCSPNGKTIILGIVEAGEILGLSAAICNTEYETTGEALETSQAKYLSRLDFLRYLQECPQAAIKAVRQLSRSYRAAHKMICSLGHADPVLVKLAKLFLSWSTNGSPGSGTLRLKNSFTHEEIAEMIGTARETVTRTLRDMRERGLVTLKGSNLVIHDHERLRLATGFQNGHCDLAHRPVAPGRIESRRDQVLA